MESMKRRPRPDDEPLNLWELTVVMAVAFFTVLLVGGGFVLLTFWAI